MTLYTKCLKAALGISNQTRNNEMIFLSQVKPF